MTLTNEPGYPRSRRRGRFIAPIADLSAYAGLPEYFVKIHNLVPTPHRGRDKAFLPREGQPERPGFRVLSMLQGQFSYSHYSPG